MSLANGGSVEEKYGDLIDAYEKGIDVMPGEDLLSTLKELEKPITKQTKGGLMGYLYDPLKETFVSDIQQQPI